MLANNEGRNLNVLWRTWFKSYLQGRNSFSVTLSRPFIRRANLRVIFLFIAFRVIGCVYGWQGVHIIGGVQVG